MGWIHGNVAWYDKCFYGANDNGSGGACESCDDRALHLAWPYGVTPMCNDQCGTNPSRACDDEVYVLDMCTGRGEWGVVKDCCPCKSQGGCNETPWCNGVPKTDPLWEKTLADLTTAFFIYLDGDLADGQIPVKVYA